MRMKAPDLQGQHLLDLLARYGTQAALSVSPEVGGRIAPSTLEKRIARARDLLGIERPRGGPPMDVDKPCRWCGRMMRRVAKNRMYCSADCKMAAKQARKRDAWRKKNGWDARDPMTPYGKSRNGGCEAGVSHSRCPHVERCRWLLERGWSEPAEWTHIICEVPRSLAARAAEAIDAQPGYRAWLATQDHQLELIEAAA